MSKAGKLLELMNMPTECKPTPKNKKEGDAAIEDAINRGMPEPKQKPSNTRKKKNDKSR